MTGAAGASSAAAVAVERGLRASSWPIDVPADLLEHLGPDGFAWFGEGVRFVTSGVVAEVDAAAAPRSSPRSRTRFAARTTPAARRGSPASPARSPRRRCRSPAAAASRCRRASPA